MHIISDRKSLQWFEVSFRSGLILHSTYRKKELERPNSFYGLMQNYENTYQAWESTCTNSPINLEECTYLAFWLYEKCPKMYFFVLKGVSEPFSIFLIQFLYSNLKNFDTNKILNYTYQYCIVLYCIYLMTLFEKAARKGS